MESLLSPKHSAIGGDHSAHPNPKPWAVVAPDRAHSRGDDPRTRPETDPARPCTRMSLEAAATALRSVGAERDPALSDGCCKLPGLHDKDVRADSPNAIQTHEQRLKDIKSHDLWSRSGPDLGLKLH